MNSWKPVVKLVYGGAKWYDKHDLSDAKIPLRFSTKEEALDDARDFMGPWMVDYNAHESEDIPTHKRVNGRSVQI